MPSVLEGEVGLKYYLLTHDVRHDFLADRLYNLLDRTAAVTTEQWTKAGGGHLSDNAPPHELWCARPGHLLVDSRLNAAWRQRFGPDGVFDTDLGGRKMFAVVPNGAREHVFPAGDWRSHHYFHTHIWPAEGQSDQKSSLRLRFDLRTPVVRPWETRGALATMYSEEVLSWLKLQGASGVSFSLVWDPDRAKPLPLAEAVDHEVVVL